MANVIRQKIDPLGDIQELMRLIAEGHPGTMSLLQTMFDKGDDPLRDMCVVLDDMNIRGRQAWIAYTECCDKNVDLFFKLIKERDPGTVVYVNSVCYKGKTTEEAVTDGGAVQ